MEHIKNIEIQNFKSIRHCVINDCKRINVFVGAPNVGKSNILEAMSIYQSVAPFSTFGKSLNDLVRFENINELYWNSDKNLKISLAFNKHEILIEKEDREFKLKKLNGTEYHGVSESDNILKIKKCQYLSLCDDRKTIKTCDDEIFSKLRFDKQIRDGFKNYLNVFNLQLLFLNNEEMTLVKKVDEANYVKIPFQNVADTFKRLIYHIISIKSNNNSVLLFEEPEAHCYEPYVLDITNAIKYDENNNQYFIVTHSDYIVQEFLRDEESRNNTNVYLVGLDDDGSTKVKLLDREKNQDVYEYGVNVFFNYDSLWAENS